MRFVNVDKKNMGGLAALYQKFLASRVPRKGERPSSAEQFLVRIRRSKKHHVFLIYEHRTLIGFCHMVAPYRRPRVGYLHGLYILPAYRNKGIGKAARRRKLAILRRLGMTTAVSRTWSSNAAMVRTNEKMGFRLYRRMRRDRRDGSDTLWYEKAL